MTLQQLESDLYRKRPDLWGLSKALRHAPDYRAEILQLLTAEDRAALKAYSEALRDAMKK